jgi:hypothetical protein
MRIPEKCAPLVIEGIDRINDIESYYVELGHGIDDYMDMGVGLEWFVTNKYKGGYKAFTLALCGNTRPRTGSVINWRPPAYAKLTYEENNGDWVWIIDGEGMKVSHYYLPFVFNNYVWSLLKRDHENEERPKKQWWVDKVFCIPVPKTV